MPTYNRAHLIRTAIDSVLEQTFDAFELIVVDDGSTDGTLDLLASVGDERLRVVSNTHTKGVAGARNTGIDCAQSDWICAIDSDDRWDERFLELLAGGIEAASNEVGVVYGSVTYLDGGHVRRVKPAVLSGYAYPRMLYEHFFYHCAAAMRTALIREVGGYDEDLDYREDTDLQLRLTERCHVLPVPEAMYFYNQSDDQLTRAYPVAAKSMERFMSKHAQLLKEHPRARFDLAGRGLTLAIRGRRWGIARRMWLTTLPTLWRRPCMFARYQKRAIFALAGLGR